jgi:hypothetical protein
LDAAQLEDKETEVGELEGRSADELVGRSADELEGRSADELVGRSADELEGRSADELEGGIIASSSLTTRILVWKGLKLGSSSWSRKSIL